MGRKKRDINLMHYDNDSLIEEFEDYLYKTHDKKIAMISSDNDIYTFDYTHRWKPTYQNQLKAKFINLIEYYKDQGHLNTIFGTLTVDPKKQSMLQAMLNIKDAWHNFHNALKDRHKKRTGNTTFDYILCAEPHQSGYIHLHYIIFGSKPSDFVDDYKIVKRFSYKTQQYEDVGISPGLDDLWRSYGFGYVNQFEYMRYDSHRLRKITDYLIKYITKGHDNNLYSAYLWLTGKRSFSTSRFLSSIMKLEKSEKKDNSVTWEYLKCFDGWLLLEQGVHVALSALTQIPEDIINSWTWLNCPSDYSYNPPK